MIRSNAVLEGDARNLAVLLDVIVSYVVNIVPQDQGSRDELSRVISLAWIARQLCEDMVRRMDQETDGRAAA